jgi:hypothetical protein
MCRCLADAGQFQSSGKFSTMASLTGSFALARERSLIRRPVPLGGKRGGKIVNRRARRVVVASGQLALRSHLRGWKPRGAHLGEPAALRRCLDEVMMPLFRARPVAGPGAGRWPAGRTVRRGRGWAVVAWLGRVRRRIQLWR